MNEVFQPELGQLAFGNPHSEFAAPDFIEAGLNHLAREIERVEGNRTQQQFDAPTGNNGTEYSTPVFSMRAYYWGECLCGWDAKAFDEPHDVGCYQVVVTGRKLDAGWTLDPEFLILKPPVSADPFTADSEILKAVCGEFGLPYPDGSAVHCTCAHRQRMAAWYEREQLGPHGHAEDCPAILPNFKCGDFAVRWYKWMGRGMTMNTAIDANGFFDIIDRCVQSVRALDVD